jgi:hypothetical protein
LPCAASIKINKKICEHGNVQTKGWKSFFKSAVGQKINLFCRGLVCVARFFVWALAVAVLQELSYEKLSSEPLPITVWRLAKVAIFNTNVDAENQCLINHKTVFETRNPALRVGAVCALNDKYSSFNFLKKASE